jgi:UDP-glucuronate 4-epimerase
MAHSYAHLYDLPITMFRFFTVDGPWGRSDMALLKFTDAILKDRPIDVYNHGKMKRDFTYVDDLVRALSMLIDAAPVTGQPASENDSLSPVAPFRVLNIGNNSPVELGDFIRAIEASCGKTAVKNLMPMQAGDVPATWADTSLLHALTQYKPSTSVEEGVDHFVRWYRAYYGILLVIRAVGRYVMQNEINQVWHDPRRY